MSNRIKYDAKNTVAGQMLAEYVSSVRAAIDKGTRLRAILDSASFGSPADDAAMATELGITGTGSAQAAHDAWALVGGSLDQIKGDAASQVAQLSRLDQG